MRTDRYCHVLTPLKRTTFPPVILFWDVESYIDSTFSDKPHRFRLGWSCIYEGIGTDGPGQTWQSLERPGDFWRVLNSAFEAADTVWAVAHNIVYDFCMSGGFDALFREGYEIESFYCKGVTTLIRAVKSKRKVLFVDSLNIFKGPLAKWGEAVGLPKLDVDLVHGSDADVDRRCQRDVEILVRLFEELADLVKRADLGSLCMTAPSQAFRAFRHKHMKHQIFLHNNEDVQALERAGYFGGRTECFQIGRLPERDYWLLDINAQYPAMMRRHSYPSALYRAYSVGSLRGLEEALRNYLVMARVRVQIDTPMVPRLENNNLVFPVGTFWTVLATPELRAVLRWGRVLDVGAMAVYQHAPLFRPYVNALYKRRRQFQADGKVLWASMVKLLLNSLYGKFGGKSEEWVSGPNHEGFPLGRFYFMQPADPHLHRAVCFGPVVWYCTGEGESIQSFPAIAAHVTSYARLYLWKFIEAAGPEHVYYCDTDSLIVDRAGRANLRRYIDPDRLGWLKVVDKSRQVHIRALKDYTFGKRKVTKGLSPAAVEQPDGTFLDLHWPKLMGVVGNGRRSGYKNRIVRKRLHRGYDKGTIMDGGRVVPFRLAESSFLP